ncbi:MAG: hypothetical protein K2G69_08280 [Muribaculaceae bacterium]|nr:hypothetical protein [Muribaculaceae bacterium]
MIEKLTHTEACKMVESALDRVARTLAYIRPRLDKKGKEVGVEARFVRKEVKYKEV